MLRFLAASRNFLANKNNLALAQSTDGVPVFKSSKLSLWQLYTVGILIKTSVALVTIKAKLVMAVFDLPAKAQALCAKQ